MHMLAFAFSPIGPFYILKNNIFTKRRKMDFAPGRQYTSGRQCDWCNYLKTDIELEVSHRLRITYNIKQKACMHLLACE